PSCSAESASSWPPWHCWPAIFPRGARRASTRSRRSAASSPRESVIRRGGDAAAGDQVDAVSDFVLLGDSHNHFQVGKGTARGQVHHGADLGGGVVAEEE